VTISFRPIAAVLAAFTILPVPQARAVEQPPVQSATVWSPSASSSTVFTAPADAGASVSEPLAPRAASLPAADPGASILAPPPGQKAAKPEHPVKRFENVFFISLPFTALYSAALTIGAAAAIEIGIRKGNLRITVPYQVVAAALACGSSAWIAWRDHSSPAPKVSPAPAAPTSP
jgi:hypothetical protein